MFTACLTGTGLPGLPGEEVIIRSPHWDQVCRPERRPPVLLELESVLAMDGLVERLERRLPARPALVAGETVPDSPHVELAVNYQRDGRVRTAHLLGYNTDPETAEAVARVLRGAIRQQARLLEPLRLRIRVTREPDLRLQVLPALACLPHVSHEEDVPPRFLGAARVRGGSHLGGLDPDRAIAARLHVDPSGRLERIEVLRGSENLLPRLERILAPVEFDPALLNGEPVPGVLTLTFVFEAQREQVGHEGLASMFDDEGLAFAREFPYTVGELASSG